MINKQTIVVLGASPKPQRFSNRAVRKLLAHGYRVIPVHPVIEVIEELPVVSHLDDINEPVHTLTMYVSPDKSERMIDEINRLNPERVIFNPGTESALLKQQLSDKGIVCIEACTLVMLDFGEF